MIRTALTILTFIQRLDNLETTVGGSLPRNDITQGLLLLIDHLAVVVPPQLSSSEHNLCTDACYGFLNNELF